MIEDNRFIWVAIISGLSFCLSFVAFIVSQIKSRKEIKLLKTKAVIELHERWWGAELWQLRRDVGKLVATWNKEQIVQTYYYIPQHDLVEGEVMDNRQKIGRIGNFFADINLMIDEGLVCEKTVYRLFGEGQLFWFLPFFEALEKERDSNDIYPKARWFSEVTQLKKKLSKYQKNEA